MAPSQCATSSILRCSPRCSSCFPSDASTQTGYAHETESQTKIATFNTKRLVCCSADRSGVGHPVGHKRYQNTMGSDPESTQYAVAGFNRRAEASNRTGQRDGLCNCPRCRGGCAQASKHLPG